MEIQNWMRDKHYEKYQLTKCNWALTDDEEKILSACSWMVKNDCTIRVTANIFEYSTTTLWRRIHNECKELSPELYEKVKEQIKENIKKRGPRG